MAMTRFSEIVDAASELSMDEQETLLEVLRHRIAQRNRARIVGEVADSRAQYSQGRAKATSVTELMDQVTGES